MNAHLKHCSKYFPNHPNFLLLPLLEHCPNVGFFLVRFFLYSDWMQEITDQKNLCIWILFTHCTLMAYLPICSLMSNFPVFLLVLVVSIIRFLLIVVLKVLLLEKHLESTQFCVTYSLIFFILYLIDIICHYYFSFL